LVVLIYLSDHLDIYTFSFEPNPDWTTFYAKGSEIWEYIKRTTIKYNLDRDVHFDTTITSAIWDDATRKWKLRADNKGTIIEDDADILVNGSGILKLV
jgi:cation diffusion facilitator CzcD-associated flavoprotein CzcO